MAISVVPFVIAGFPDMMKIRHGQRTAVLLALILSFLLVLSYCLYQVTKWSISQIRLDLMNFTQLGVSNGFYSDCIISDFPSMDPSQEAGLREAKARDRRDSEARSNAGARSAA
jgi:hypothetical protein